MSHVKIDYYKTYIITLPEVFKFYSRDFGNTSKEVIIAALRLADMNNIVHMIKDSDAFNFKLRYEAYSWNSEIVL